MFTPDAVAASRLAHLNGLQRRRDPLPRRSAKVRQALRVLETALRDQDPAAIERAKQALIGIAGDGRGIFE